MPARRLLSVIVACALVAGLAACGKAQESSISKGETEGVYVDVGELKYQVQISRELNPGAIPEDRTMLSGLSASAGSLNAAQTWFAVFIRIENESDEPQPPAIDYAIEDSDGKEYHPLRLGDSNPFHYVRTPVPAHGIAPDPDSVAAQNSIGGMELLFKLERTSLDARPLVLKIHSPTDPKAVAEVDLDV